MRSAREARPAEDPVFVLGMHRSGTSLVTGVLHLGGVHLGPPERLMEPKAENESGFWENLDLFALNESLLSFLGGSWSKPAGLAPGWEEASELDPLYERAGEIISQHFGNGAPWAFKDPKDESPAPLLA